MHVAAPSDEHLGRGTNESYTITVAKRQAIIAAPYVFGGMHGLETFMQPV